jgi:hypothetical protein
MEVSGQLFLRHFTLREKLPVKKAEWVPKPAYAHGGRTMIPRFPGPYPTNHVVPLIE